MCYQGQMRDKANCLASYVGPPANIQYPPKTVVLESENYLSLLLVQFPAFTAIFCIIRKLELCFQSSLARGTTFGLIYNFRFIL